MKRDEFLVKSARDTLREVRSGEDPDTRRLLLLACAAILVATGFVILIIAANWR